MPGLFLKNSGVSSLANFHNLPITNTSLLVYTTCLFFSAESAFVDRDSSEFPFARTQRICHPQIRQRRVWLETTGYLARSSYLDGRQHKASLTWGTQARTLALMVHNFGDYVLPLPVFSADSLSEDRAPSELPSARGQKSCQSQARQQNACRNV